MADSGWPIGQFGGLNLTAAPDEVGPFQCIDCLNIDLDKRGQVRSRDGYTNFVTPSNVNRFYQITRFYTTAGLKQVVFSGQTKVGAGPIVPKVWAYDNAATPLSSAGVSAGALLVRTGTPSAEYLYALDATTTWTRWNGTAFSTVLGMPAARFAAVQATDNRLVVGYVGTNVSRVQFSDPGAPETFGANNYVDLDPGDGEPITAIAAWHELVFVFKQTKYFVFYGTSTGPTGDPVFNYRPVRITGAYADNSILTRPAIAGTEGVYFFDGRSVWLTSGGEPTRVSSAIDPYLQAKTLPFFSSASGLDTSSIFASISLSYAVGRLWLTLPASSGSTTFVYDPELATWMLWNMPVTSATQVRLSADNEELVFASTTNGSVYRFGPAYSDDNGTAITSRYRSGLYDLGIPDAEKDIRATRVYGTGAPTFKMSKDFGSLGTGQALTLGTSPAIASGMATNNPRPATLFSYELSGTSAWSVQRLAHQIRGQRPASAHSS
jgi:hypothetical protein